MSKSTFRIEGPSPGATLNDVRIVETFPDGTEKTHYMDENENYFTYPSAQLWILSKES